MSADKEVTIYDIAKRLNISATTVSRGLKNHPTINKNTRRKIAEIAEKLGYHLKGISNISTIHIITLRPDIITRDSSL